MQIEQFIDLVKRMRSAQKEYFTQGRTREALERSKQLEREVDAEIKLSTDPPNQTKMF